MPLAQRASSPMMFVCCHAGSTYCWERVVDAHFEITAKYMEYICTYEVTPNCYLAAQLARVLTVLITVDYYNTANGVALAHQMSGRARQELTNPRTNQKRARRRFGVLWHNFHHHVAVIMVASRDDFVGL